MRARIRVGRPVAHPLLLPRPYRRHIAPTVLARRRDREARVAGSFAAAVHGATAGLADMLRCRLEEVRSRLRHFVASLRLLR